MNFYDRYVLPHFLDLLCGLPAVAEQRAELLPQAQGRVLEIGIGTGLNLPFYDLNKVSALVGLDPAGQLHGRARRRIAKTGMTVELLALSAESIPAQDASFDTVVLTFTLCSIPDPVAALKEMRRVLKPEGRLLFCEHGLAPDASVRRWQRRLTPYWRPVAGGCHLDRDISRLLKDAGFDVSDLQARYVDGPRAFAYHYLGSARPG